MERNNSGVNGVGTEKERSQRRWNGKKAALTALDRNEMTAASVNALKALNGKNTGTALNREKSGVNGVGTE